MARPAAAADDVESALWKLAAAGRVLMPFGAACKAVGPRRMESLVRDGWVETFEWGRGRCAILSSRAAARLGLELEHRSARDPLRLRWVARGRADASRADGRPAEVVEADLGLVDDQPSPLEHGPRPIDFSRSSEPLRWLRPPRRRRYSPPRRVRRLVAGGARRIRAAMAGRTA